MVTTLSRKRRRAALKQLTARDIMTAGPKSLRPTATARSAVRFFRTHGIPSAPVTDSAGRLIGIVSQADLFDLWGRGSDADCNKTHAGIYQDRYFRCADFVVKQVMRPDVFFVPVDASVSKIIQTFLARETRRLFVIDQEEMLVGEISIFDLLRAIGEHVDPRRFSRHRP